MNTEPVRSPVTGPQHRFRIVCADMDQAATITPDVFLRTVPKVELHCHFEGAIRPQTVLDLAAKHGLAVPGGVTVAGRLYDYERSEEFFELFGFVAATMNDADDYARCVYETVEDGVASSNLRYREMFFNPTLHTTRGVPTATMLEGMAAGARAALADLGVRVAFIADIYRSDAVSSAEQMLDELLEHRCDELIGLGMDGEEAPDPPEKFAAAFQRAGRAGLKRTSHASEDAPPANITTCLDLLGCERIDHGYYILDDPAVVTRALDQALPFTTCVTSTVKAYFSSELTEHPIPRMLDAGLLVTLNSDDPTMVRTDLGQEYVRLCSALAYGPDTVRRLCLNGVDASWLDDVDKAAMRHDFEAQIDDLERRLDPSPFGTGDQPLNHLQDLTTK
jgi:adenosine deaminase